MMLLSLPKEMKKMDLGTWFDIQCLRRVKVNVYGVSSIK
jgi:hypothetical protein